MQKVEQEPLAYAAGTQWQAPIRYSTSAPLDLHLSPHEAILFVTG